jgi:hypothetical protein
MPCPRANYIRNTTAVQQYVVYPAAGTRIAAAE